MKANPMVTMLLATLMALGATAVTAGEITLYAPQFPTGNSVSLDMIASAQAPRARVEAKVTFIKEGQAEVEVEFDDMKPAVLFGGDITAYVVWAVTKDGHATNLGELATRDADGKGRYRTGLKSFAILITAEPYYLVRKPSEMVMYHNASPASKRIPSDDFVFSTFAPAATHQLDSIVNVAWDSEEPLELIQAEKAHELATRIDAETYAPDLFSQSTVTLTQARSLAGAGRKRKASADYALRSVALSNDAIGISERKIEAARLEAEIAQRQAEMEALEARAEEAERMVTQAESRRVEAESARLLSETQLQQAQTALTQAAAQTEALSAERAELEAGMVALRTEQAGLLSAVEGLKADRERLSSRLDDALSQVADTRNTARGTIINLPDILFDLNESTLKPEAKMVIAKLAGILLIMRDLNTRIEGHTDSTGSYDYNMRLSDARARSVRDFLFQQGISGERMTVVGYGPNRPIADNGSQTGRAQNRRVEIVIAEGTIGEASGAD